MKNKQQNSEVRYIPDQEFCLEDYEEILFNKPTFTDKYGISLQEAKSREVKSILYPHCLRTLTFKLPTNDSVLNDWDNNHRNGNIKNGICTITLKTERNAFKNEIEYITQNKLDFIETIIHLIIKFPNNTADIINSLPTWVFANQEMLMQILYSVPSISDENLYHDVDRSISDGLKSANDYVEFCVQQTNPNKVFKKKYKENRKSFLNKKTAKIYFKPYKNYEKEKS